MKKLQKTTKISDNSLSKSSKFDVSAFVDKIKNGAYVSPFENYPNGGILSSDKLIMAKDLLVFDLDIIIQNLQNIIKHRKELTERDYGFDKFSEYFDDYVVAFNTMNFVDSFEAVLKLKLYTSSRSCFNSLISDPEYCLAIEAVCLKITSTYFKAFDILQEKGAFKQFLPESKIKTLCQTDLKSQI